MRWVPGVRDQRAWLYIPDDPRLRVRAAQIAEQRRHSLRRERRAEQDEPLARPIQAPFDQGAVQLSMFEALSATPIAGSAGWQPWQELLPDDWDDSTDGTIEVDIALPPLLAGHPSPDGTGRTRRQAKDALRTANADGARDIARLTGQTHAQVNGQLNRMIGIRSINDATVEQLQARLAAADRWYERLRG